MFVFTDKRLIFVNRQGLTGSKVELQSIPYRSITRFTIETAGTFDLDAQLKIWLTGSPGACAVAVQQEAEHLRGAERVWVVWLRSPDGLMKTRKKLIEVALPRERSKRRPGEAIRHGQAIVERDAHAAPREWVGLSKLTCRNRMNRPV